MSISRSLDARSRAGAAADVIVVGGGSCGSVVASRLSEDPSCSVVLIESGQGFGRLADVPPDILDARILPVGPGSAWIDTYPSELTASSEQMSAVSRSIARGRVLGGSGAVNGAYFIRARPSDFDAWPSSWSFSDVLPYYRMLETDTDFGGEYHGNQGPVPVSRIAPERRGRITELFVDAAARAGFSDEPDKNSPTAGGGVGSVPRNVFGSRRVNAAVAYLFPALGRPNLTVRSGSTVTSVLFDGSRVAGVRIVADGVVSDLRARTVVLSAGAVRSPQLLMLSGIGPSKHLAEMGISVAVDHPRVGRGFSDHPEVGVYYEFSESTPSEGVLEAVLHVDDLEIRPYSTSFDRMIPGLGIGYPMIGVGLMRPDSRGDITLMSSDPSAAPFVRYRYLENVADRRALSAGIDLVGDLMGDLVPMAGVVGDPLLGRLGTSLHLSGSCGMGGDDAVLDEFCRVRGIDGLHVVDTSAFPVVPSRGPHATAIMLAERASEFVRAHVA